ncbi:MAG TPA: heparan-alpha-glucosaminide N-acetyltransferase domain-containing protein [Anaerolineales bacterium]|jgi:fucose 4-O-acetylase-like acetyltransferase|nr:heparan-alpha-glucosaminide N-acetyltransferase domain-containing protein [Anaerolineales bacterium]
MQPKTRDLSLDLLKGLGCLLMIMAHMPFKVGFYKDLTFLGGFAPVPFYAVTGVTAAFQAQRYKPRAIMLYYLFLFLFGFALSGFNSPDFLRPPVIHFDIIQIIAVGSLAVYLLEYYFRPPIWVYLILGVFSFLIKLALDVLLPVQEYPFLAGTLLMYSGTFPIFPWLFLFFLGVFVYRISPRWNLASALVFIAMYFVLVLFGFDMDYHSKYDMSVGYFLLSCILLFALFFLARRFEIFQRGNPLNPLVFFGQNSLLFLFVHFAAIGVLSLRLQLDQNIHLFRLYPFLFWLLIFLVTWIAMVVLIFYTRARWLAVQFNRIWVWVVLVALVLTIPLIPHNGVVRWAEVGLGTIGALYYHQLGRVLKQEQVSPSD